MADAGRDLADGPPPKPRLCVRVGVTGHRLKASTVAVESAVIEAISRVLSMVRDGATALLAEEAAAFAPEPPRLALTTSLAEGADQLAARAALGLGFELSAALPFTREEYASDFVKPRPLGVYRACLDQARSVFELEGRRETSDRAYEAAGLMVLRHTDLLVAVWDGGRAAGRGGTAEIVQAAVDDGTPVLWIRPGEPGARLLRRKPFSLSADALDLAETAPELDAAAVREVVFELAAPPHARSGPAGAEARRRLFDFYAEKRVGRGSGLAYRALQSLLGVRRAGVAAAPPGPAFRDVIAPFHDALPEALSGRVRAAFRRCDAMAVRYGDAHRSASVVNFGFAAIAVGLALMSVLPVPGASALKPLWVGLELAVLALIGLNTWAARRGRRHDRWLDYRALTEHLRSVRLLALTGSAAAKLGPSHVSDSDEPGPLWTGWYYRALVREIGLPNTVADARFREVVAEAARAEFADQVAYHRRAAARTETMDRRLERMGEGFLYATVLVGLGYLGVWGAAHRGVHALESVYKAAGGLVTFAAAFFPAVGAAGFGIREQGGFERQAALSEIMAVQLQKVLDELDAAGPAPRLSTLSGLVEHGAAVMTAEVADWGFIFRAKPLALPG